MRRDPRSLDTQRALAKEHEEDQRIEWERRQRECNHENTETSSRRTGSGPTDYEQILVCTDCGRTWEDLEDARADGAMQTA